MKKIGKSTAKTPSITKEAKEFDGINEVQRGIRMAVSLNARVINAEKEKLTEKTDIGTTPIVTAEDIKNDMYR